MLNFNRLKDGKKYALTLSYDDGKEYDRRLIAIMNKYGIRGTFHLNSGRLDKPDRVKRSELVQLYKNHEVSCHGTEHRTLSMLPKQNIVQEVLEDRRALEQASGTIIRGMSYANGAYSEDAVSALRTCGIVYARTTQNTDKFSFPQDFMKWHPTCHHKNCMERGEHFLKIMGSGYSPFPRLLYVWGHSYEFENDNNWNMIEQFCQMMSDRDDIWYATNIEIYEYITAQRQLVISADNSMVYNPTALQLWFMDDGKEYCINPGETIMIK